MRVLIAPDKFAGTLTAVQAADRLGVCPDVQHVHGRPPLVSHG